MSAECRINSSFCTLHSSLVENSLTHVALSSVWKDGDDALAFAETFGDAKGCGSRRPGRATAEHAFGLGQSADGRKRLVVHNHHYLICQLPVVIRRHELVLPDA